MMIYSFFPLYNYFKGLVKSPLPLCFPVIYMRDAFWSKGLMWLALSHHYLASMGANINFIWHTYIQCHKFPSIGLIRRLLVDILIALSADIMYNYFTYLQIIIPWSLSFFHDLISSGRIHERGRSGTLRSFFYQEAMSSICLCHSRMNSLLGQVALLEMGCHIISSHNLG